MRVETPVRFLKESEFCYRVVVIDETNSKITYNTYFGRDEERANKVYSTIKDINARFNHDIGTNNYTYILKGNSPGKTVDELNKLKIKFNINE